MNIYEVDVESPLRQPTVRLEETPRVPGIDCSHCGRWAGGDRRRLTTDSALDLGAFCHLPVEEWKSQRSNWAELLEVDERLLTPGLFVGPPRGELLVDAVPALAQPVPGLLWVSQRSKDLLSEAKGIGFQNVELIGSPGTLWEIQPVLSVPRTDVAAEDLIECDLCMKRRFPNPSAMEIDLRNWSGEALFFIEGFRHILICSEELRSALLPLSREWGVTFTTVMHS